MFLLIHIHFFLTSNSRLKTFYCLGYFYTPWNFLCLYTLPWSSSRRGTNETEHVTVFVRRLLFHFTVERYLSVIFCHHCDIVIDIVFNIVVLSVIGIQLHCCMFNATSQAFLHITHFDLWLWGKGTGVTNNIDDGSVLLIWLRQWGSMKNTRVFPTVTCHNAVKKAHQPE